jgi:O-antigen/teichoic acid export membrane protein
VTTVGGLAITLLAPTVRVYLNPAYSSMGAIEVMAILCVGSVIRTVASAWASLQRSRRNLRPTLVTAFFAALTAVIVVPLLSHQYGAVGGAVGLTLAYSVQSAGATLHVIFTRRGRVKVNTQSNVSDQRIQ